MKQRAVVLAWATLLTALAGQGHAAPFLPRSGAEVVETLRSNGAQPQQQALRRLRAQLAAAPGDVALATELARRYIALGRQDADPRYYGYAQAALAPWWADAAAPTEVLMLRATLLQATHHFDAAQRDLAAVIGRERAHVQAWLTQATVQVVRADYIGARASCARLAALAPPIVAATCAANVGSMTGQLASSRALLDTVFAREGGQDSGIDAWVRTLLAELAERAGDEAAARRWYQAALAQDPADTYLSGAYADFLLDHHGAAQVARLLAARQNVDGLLLRYALALQQLGRKRELAQVSAELDARFAAAMQRGDGLHQREQAMYELRLKGNGARALVLAGQNWAVQKESADARVLLEAAVATRDRQAAAPVLNWMRANQIEDVRLARLAHIWGALQ